MGIKSYVTTSMIIFIIGVLGISLNRTNLIILLMSLELLLLATSMIFIVGAAYYDTLFSQLFTLIILTVAAAESAIGLAIIVTYFKIRGKISTKLLNTLKG